MCGELSFVLEFVGLVDFLILKGELMVIVVGVGLVGIFCVWVLV